MSERVVYVTVKNRAQARRNIRRLPEALARGDIGRGYRNGLAFAILSKITQNLVDNSQSGGTPDVDLNWPPLAPATIHKRLHGTRYRSEQTRKARERNLTAAQKKDLRRRVNRLKNEYIEAGMEPSTALGLARAQAFNKFRRSGLDIPTSRDLTPILRDTGVGLNALTPVAFDPDSGGYQPPRAGTHRETGQEVDPVDERGPGEISVGVKGYMARHHTGGRRLPQRRLWPDPKEWPDSWWDHLDDVTAILTQNIAIQLAEGEA